MGKILSLWGKIRVNENLFSGIFYTVEYSRISQSVLLETDEI